MLIDMWKHFPDKFKDSIVEDQVLEQVKNSLRKQKISQVQTIAIYGQLIHLFEYIVKEKLDTYGKVTADKIANLIAHILRDFDPVQNTAKEFILSQTFPLLKEQLIDLNDFIKVILRLFQSRQNSFGLSDQQFVMLFIDRSSELTDKNIICLLDFNCHLFMNDLSSIVYSKTSIVKLTRDLHKFDGAVNHFIKFIRLVFNWLYKAKLGADKTGHADMNLAREKQMIHLIKMLLYSEYTSPRVWLVARNMAALINYQIRKFTSNRRIKKQEQFQPGFKELILAPNPLDKNNPEAEKVSQDQIMARFDLVFDLHLNPPGGVELQDQLDKLITSVDLSKKYSADDVAFEDDLNEGTMIPRYESERSKHAAKIEQFKLIDVKLKKIKLGVFADKKVMKDLTSIRDKRRKAEHDKILFEAQRSMEEQEKIDKFAKQVEGIKIMTGTRKEDTEALTLEQLTRPLGI